MVSSSHKRRTGRFAVRGGVPVLDAARIRMGRRVRVACDASQAPVSIQVLEPTSWSEISSSGGSVGKPHHERPQNDDLVITASIKVNLLLLIGKVAACVMAVSPVIVATLVDSTVDVLV